nr:MAG: hypothetical protein [Porcellio scaber clopovirus]
MALVDSFCSYRVVADERLIMFITMEDLKNFNFVKTSITLKFWLGVYMRIAVHKEADDFKIYLELFTDISSLPIKVSSYEDFSECIYHIKIKRSSIKDIKNKCLLFEGVIKSPSFKSAKPQPYKQRVQERDFRNNRYLFHTLLEKFNLRDLLNHDINNTQDKTSSTSTSTSTSSSSSSSSTTSGCRGCSDNASSFSSSHFPLNKKDHQHHHHYDDDLIKIKIGLSFSNLFERKFRFRKVSVSQISKPIASPENSYFIEPFLFDHSVFMTDGERDCDKIIKFLDRTVFDEANFTCMRVVDYKKIYHIPLKKSLDLKEHDVDTFKEIDRRRWWLLFNRVRESPKLVFNTSGNDYEVRGRDTSLDGYIEKTKHFQNLKNALARDENLLGFVCYKKTSSSGNIDIFLEGINSKKLDKNLRNRSRCISSLDSTSTSTSTSSSDSTSDSTNTSISSDRSSSSYSDEEDKDIQDILVIDKRTFEYVDEADMFHKLSNFRKRTSSLSTTTTLTTNISYDDGLPLIKLYNVGVESVIEIIRFLIKGHVPESFLRKPINIGELLILANYFQIDRLINYLNIYVRSILDRNNVDYFFCISEKFNIVDLREKTLNFLFRQHNYTDGSNVLYNLFPEYHYLVLTHRPRQFDAERSREESRWYLESDGLCGSEKGYYKGYASNIKNYSLIVTFDKLQFIKENNAVKFIRRTIL